MKKNWSTRLRSLLNKKSRFLKFLARKMSAITQAKAGVTISHKNLAPIEMLVINLGLKRLLSQGHLTNRPQRHFMATLTTMGKMMLKSLKNLVKTRKKTKVAALAMMSPGFLAKRASSLDSAAASGENPRLINSGVSSVCVYFSKPSHAFFSQASLWRFGPLTPARSF